MRGLPSLRALDEEAAGGPRSRLWLALEPTDMRCGFDRLAERVRTVIGQDPLSGHGFIFRSRRGDRLKILTWDQDGFVLWYKRLEVGVFKLPRPEGGGKGGGATGQRTGDDPGWDRRVAARARGALCTPRGSGGREWVKG